MQIHTLEFKAAMARVSKAIASKPILPVLEHVMLEKRGARLYLTTTDLNLYIETSIQVAESEPDFKIGALADELNKTVAKLKKDELELLVNEERIEVKCGRKRFNIAACKTDDFPPPHTNFTKQIYFASGLELTKAIERLPFHDVDNAKTMMNGIYLKHLEDEKVLHLAATDGYSLGHIEIPYEGEAISLILAGASLKVLSGALKLTEDDDLTIDYSDTHARFTSGSTSITTRFINDRYPDYNKIIPAAFKTAVVVEAATLKESLEQAMIYAPQTSLITLTMQPAFLTVSAVKQGGDFSEEIDLERLDPTAAPPDLQIHFNVSRLLLALKQCLEFGTHVALHCNEPNKPVVLRPLNVDHYLTLVMPLQNK